MRQKKHETVSFRRRTVSLLLALAVVLTSLCFGMSTAVNAAVTLYFDTSQNTAWNPGDGEQLYATFTDSGGNKVGSNVVLSTVGSSLYQVSAPSGAENIQLYLLRSGYTMPDTVPGTGETRVFLKNNANWNPPYAYSWTNGGEMDWPGSQMSKVSADSALWWYYDTPYANVIFGNGTGTSSPQQSADLEISGKNLIFSKYNGNSGWDSAPYYKKYAELSLGSRPSGANEIYAMSGDEVKFSKYPYSSRSFSPKLIYLYNPDWTSSSDVKVTWDLDDPYTDTFSMTSATEYGAGYYKAEVPYNAVIRFSYNYATSMQTSVPAESYSNCFNMKNGSGVWCNVNDTQRESTDYIAPVESSGHNTGSAFWVDAVYYDYYSDRELEYGWLNPLRAGTGFNYSSNDWFEFKNFNSKINSTASANSSVWRFPLYFGNLCGTQDAFDGNNAHDDYKGPNFWSNKGYLGPNTTGLTNLDYAVNDSNGLWANGQDAGRNPDYHYSVRGLTYGSLDGDGNIQYADGHKMPYFDSEWIKSNSIGKTVTSSFPFRQSNLGSGVTKYSFDSNGAADNVFFNWSGTTPTSVGYGQGEGYGIRDGIQYFMNPDEIDSDTGQKYSQNKYYGIFPFNSTSGNGGNNELDYGFGIKMEMDFRVPENGKLPNGQDCTFSYSGDDDLWVYLSEYDDNGNLSNSQLVLDLGGNHKKAVGEINFATMTSTATKSMKPTETGLSRDYVYIVDSYNWGDNLWIWAWNNDTDGKWYKAQYDSSAGCYRVGAGWGPQGDANGDRFDSKTKFLVCNGKENWGSQTKQDTILSHMGRMTYTNNLRYCADKAVSYSYNSTYSSDFGFEKKRDSSYKTLDPGKTYHMSVFYMERGMLESNCKIEFTMTPAQNDLKVRKEIETADVNPGLREDIKNSDFEFKNSVNGTVNKTARYSLNGAGGYSLNDGSYYLSNQDTADFDNQYATGSEILVTESKPSGGIEYGKTEWKVIDNSTGELLSSGTDTSHPYGNTSTSSFKLENANKNSYVTRQVNFVNTPSVSDLTIEKEIVDKDGKAVDASVVDDFAFELLLDLGDGKYKPRKLTYEVSASGDVTELTTGDSGTFRFSSSDKVTFKGIPTGAKFMLRELTASGYKPYKIVFNGAEYGESYGYTGSYPIRSSDPAVILGTSNKIKVTNKQQPVQAFLQLRKYLAPLGNERSLYTDGNLFEFKVTGLDETPYKYDEDLGEVVKSSSAAGMDKKVSETDSEGVVTFANDGGSDKFLRFTKEGVYIFKMTEVQSVPEVGDTSVSDDIDWSAIGSGDNKFLAVVEVRDDGTGALVVDSVNYYHYDGGTVNEDSFDDPIDSDIPEFDNPVKPGTVKIEKTDNKNDPLNGAVFSIYKVDNDITDYTGREEKVLDDDELDSYLVNKVHVTDAETAGKSGSGGALGIAMFEQLDIYKRDSSGEIIYTEVYDEDLGETFTVPEYQTYALLEKTTVDGHAKSKVVSIFKFPVSNSYGITFSYINGELKNPETAGPGPYVFRTIGIAAIVFACAALLAYVLYFRKKGFSFAFLRKK